MIWYRFGEWILRKRFMVLLWVGLLTVFFAYFAARTQLVTSFGDLLPQDHPFIKVAHKYDRFFGSVNNVSIMVVARDGDIFKPEILNKIFYMTARMDLVYGIQHGSVQSVAYASYIRPLPGGILLNTPVMDPANLPKTQRDADRVKASVHTNPGAIWGPYVSLDDKAALIQASFLSSRLDYKLIFDDIYKIIVRPMRDKSVRILRRRAADPVRMGLSLHASDFQNLRCHSACGVGAALSLLPRLAWCTATHNLRSDMRRLGVGFCQVARLQSRPPRPGYSIPDNGTRRQPFGADARPLLRGVLPA
jgi:hypothetical protein